MVLGNLSSTRKVPRPRDSVVLADVQTFFEDQAYHQNGRFAHFSAKILAARAASAMSDLFAISRIIRAERSGSRMQGAVRPAVVPLVQSQ